MGHTTHKANIAIMDILANLLRNRLPTKTATIDRIQLAATGRAVCWHGYDSLLGLEPLLSRIQRHAARPINQCQYRLTFIVLRKSILIQ
jgi:hypothetical protein